MSSLGLTPSSYTGPQPQRDHDKVLTVSSSSRAADEAAVAGRSPAVENPEKASRQLESGFDVMSQIQDITQTPKEVVL